MGAAAGGSSPGAALLGIVNVGGRLVPAVSPARLLGIDTDGVPPPLGRHAFARLLVLAVRAQPFALPVDEVLAILDASRPPPAGAATSGPLIPARSPATTPGAVAARP